MGDLAVMIAPKKLVLVCGKDDDIFPIHGVQKTYEIIQTLYQAWNVPSNCELVIGSEGHRFYADDAWPVMKKLLKNSIDPDFDIELTCAVKEQLMISDQ